MVTSYRLKTVFGGEGGPVGEVVDELLDAAFGVEVRTAFCVVEVQAVLEVDVDVVVHRWVKGSAPAGEDFVYEEGEDAACDDEQERVVCHCCVLFSLAEDFHCQSEGAVLVL
jgi:hypothetical protein